MEDSETGPDHIEPVLTILHSNQVATIGLIRGESHKIQFLPS